VFIRPSVRLSACVKSDIEDFIKFRRKDTNLVHLGQKYQAVYIKTMTALCIVVTIVMPFVFMYVACFVKLVLNYYYYYYYYFILSY